MNVKMGASKQEGSRVRRAAVGVYTTAAATTTTERNGVFKLLHFLFNGWKLFWEAFYWRREENADEFKQISTTLNYYTIVRRRIGIRVPAEKSWSDRDDRVQGPNVRLKCCAKPKPTSIGSSSMCSIEENGKWRTTSNTFCISRQTVHSSCRNKEHMWGKRIGTGSNHR